MNTNVPSTDRNEARGFTLIELMAVIAIIAILGALAIGAYMKNVRNAHRTEVIADLSNIALRERTAFSVYGHYASTTAAETQTYPVDPGQLQNQDGEMQWLVTDPLYTQDAKGANDAYFFGGGAEHGFDALNFVPEGAESWCSYGVISGLGTNSPDQPDVPANGGTNLASQIFQNGTQPFFARDWFYAFAFCDFDRDGDLWDFTVGHFSSDIQQTNDGE